MSKQVSIDTIDELKRCMTVQIPGDSVESEVKTRLRSLAGTIRVDGFRKGKVPVNVVETKYGARVRNEVANELVQKGLQEALMEQEVKIAGQPEVDVKPYESGQDIEFSATFEVYPEIEIPVLGGVKIERPKAEISEQDTAQVIERMRFQKARWTAVNRAAAEGDQVFIDYKEESPPEGSSVETQQISLVLGNGIMPADFEQQLVGAVAGDKLDIAVVFSENHADVIRAGKQAKYAVTVISVSEAELPEIDENFVREFGIESGAVPELQAEVKNNMQRELDGKISSLLTARVYKAVSDHVDIRPPNALVDTEMNTLSAQLREKIHAMGVRGQGMTMPSDEELRTQARQRVTVNLLVSEVTKRGEIAVSHEQIRQEVEKIAELYEDPAQITQWYYEDMNRLATIEFKLAQDAFVEWVLNQCEVTEQVLSFDELMNTTV